jgi:2-(1,2-epoxy-1,2-dihydrophenyl)acetyl-CoA isomerase
MSAPAIGYARADGIATITLSRPEKLNAFTSPMLREVREAIARAGSDDGVRVLVLTGAGRAFSAGQDLTAIPSSSAGVGEVLERDYTPVVTALMEHPKVTVAALNGPAFGAAANIALACDIAVAAERASICQAFVRIGLLPDAGGTWLLPRIAGLRNAMALALTGDALSAREAQAMGLVYRVFADESFGEELAQFTRKLAANSPLACRLIKQALRASPGNGLGQQLSLEAELQAEAADSAFFRAALQAFVTKGG